MALIAVLDEKLKEWGASFTGYSNVKSFLNAGFKELPYAVTIGVRLSDFIVDEIIDKPTYTYFHHYRAVNTLIDQITLKGMLFIQENGFKALAVPASQTVKDLNKAYSGIFPHKTAAVVAGLGWIGRNALFISPLYGPRLRLGTILTDMQVSSETTFMESQCKNCRLCVEHCPAMALTGNSWSADCEREHVIDAKACSDYMNEKFKHIGRGSVCGICVKVCPYGQGV